MRGQVRVIRLAAKLATDEFGAGSDVAPLVASAELQTAVAVAIESEIIESCRSW